MEISMLPAETAAAPASTALAPADSAAVRQFSNFMQGNAEQLSQSPAVTFSSAVTGPAGAVTSTATSGPLATSLTELLRERASALSDRWKSTLSKVAKVDEGSSYSVLIKTQFEVGKINLEHAVMTQGISRSTQNVDSLVKMQ